MERSGITEVTPGRLKLAITICQTQDGSGNETGSLASFYVYLFVLFYLYRITLSVTLFVSINFFSLYLIHF